MKRILIYLSMIMAVMASCGDSHHTNKEEEKQELVATIPLKTDTTIYKDYVCQIKAIQHIELRALERGYLQKIYVDEGQYVKQGQLMFQIMPLVYNAELQKAEAEANFVEVEYQNTKRLADSNIVAPSELALAKAKLNKARAELAMAKVHRSFTEIRAPFTGIMDHFHVRLGSLLEEGDLLTTLSDNSQLWVYFNVPEAEYLNFKNSPSDKSIAKVNLIMANGMTYPYDGYIKTIEADFNNETGNIDFRATFPNPERLLRHGETGNIRMAIPLKGALLIPQKATFEVLEKRYVFVVEPNNTVRQQEVSIAAEMPDLYVVKDGLKEGEKFLLEGIRKVKHGDRVTFKFETPQTVLPKLNVYVE